MVDEKIVTQNQADQYLAGRINDSGSATRVALNAILPKGGGTSSTALTQWVRQNASGTWPNYVRDSNIAGRIYLGFADSTRAPSAADGLTVGDSWWTRGGIRVATAVPPVGSGAPTWTTVSTGTTTPDPDPDPDPDPGTGNPDQSTPSATSRPFALLSTEGVWRTSTGVSLVQALSDQAASGASATPTGEGSGVSVTLDMSNFAHTVGNSIAVTLWGVESTTPGTVQVWIGYKGTAYGSTKTMPITDQASSPAFVWPASDLLSLPVSTWRDVEITISRASGGFTNFMDVTMQSIPPTTEPGPVDVGDPASITWANGAVWTSQLQAAPLARASAAIVSYIRGQAGSALRLDCLPGGDAPPMWMVPASAQRVNITPPATSGRGSVTLMHTSDGKGALDAVPLPASATTPGNLFKTAVVGCIETKQVWELLGLTKTATGWSAEWGGRIDGTTTNGGVHPTGTGYTGSGLAYTAAAVKVSEAKAAAGGQVAAIQHALGLNLNYDSASSKFCWPATRSDGDSSDAGAPQMGSRVRLKSTFNVEGSSLTPLGKAIAKALQVYGAVIMGGAERPSILCESGAVEQAKTGVDPWGAALAGKTIDTVLAGLPLDQLEAVSPGWGGPNWKEEEGPIIVDPVDPVDPGPGPGPGTGSAAMRILGPSRSGLPWHSGCKADGPYSTAMVEKFGQWRGRPVDGGITYPDYGGANSSLSSIQNSGWCASLYNGFPGRIYYGMAPFSRQQSGDKNWDARLWGRLANGDFDSTIDAQASFLANQGRGNSVIRVAWEWNGDWYTWRAGLAGVNNFKNGFRRIVQRFRAKSNAFKFVFEINHMTPLYGSSGNTALTLAYPGDDVVDIVGVDCYQFAGEGAPDGAFHRYLRTRGSYGPGLDDVADFARSRGKGLGVFEWGIHGVSGYGDRPDFIQGYWDWFVKNKDVLVAESYFNEYEDYIKCSLYNSTNGAIQNPKSAAKYKELWSRGV